MVGRELAETYPVRKTPPGPVALELKNLTENGVKNVSFKARKGEILGMAGLVGAGRSEIMKVVHGTERRQWGEILVDGEPAAITSPSDALKYGIGLVPEDRKRDGCFLMNGVSWNIVFAAVRKLARMLLVNTKKEQDLAKEYIRQLSIKTPNMKQKVLNLSGGNQQKVVVAKTLAADTSILVFDEPTMGRDCGGSPVVNRSPTFSLPYAKKRYRFNLFLHPRPALPIRLPETHHENAPGAYPAGRRH